MFASGLPRARGAARRGRARRRASGRAPRPRERRRGSTARCAGRRAAEPDRADGAMRARVDDVDRAGPPGVDARAVGADRQRRDPARQAGRRDRAPRREVDRHDAVARRHVGARAVGRDGDARASRPPTPIRAPIWFVDDLGERHVRRRRWRRRRRGPRRPRRASRQSRRARGRRRRILGERTLSMGRKLRGAAHARVRRGRDPERRLAALPARPPGGRARWPSPAPRGPRSPATLGALGAELDALEADLADEASAEAAARALGGVDALVVDAAALFVAATETATSSPRCAPPPTAAWAATRAVANAAWIGPGGPASSSSSPRRPTPARTPRRPARRSRTSAGRSRSSGRAFGIRTTTITPGTRDLRRDGGRARRLPALARRRLLQRRAAGPQLTQGTSTESSVARVARDDVLGRARCRRGSPARGSRAAARTAGRAARGRPAPAAGRPTEIRIGPQSM